MLRPKTVLIALIVVMAIAAVGLVIYFQTLPYRPPYEHIYIQPTPASTP